MRSNYGLLTNVLNQTPGEYEGYSDRQRLALARIRLLRAEEMAALDDYPEGTDHTDQLVPNAGPLNMAAAQVAAGDEQTIAQYAGE